MRFLGGPLPLGFELLAAVAAAMWLTTAVKLLQPNGPEDLGPSRRRWAREHRLRRARLGRRHDGRHRGQDPRRGKYDEGRSADDQPPEVAVARYTRGGRLDSSLSDDGRTVLGLPVSRVLAEVVAIEADGRSSLTRASVEASVAHEPGDRDAAAVT